MITSMQQRPVNGRTMSVSPVAASYSAGVARAIAQVIMGYAYAAPVVAYPAFEPPRTRKRFKTSVGNVPRNEIVERKRSLAAPTRAPRKSQGMARP